MRIIQLLTFICLFASCQTSSILQIPANQSVSVDLEKDKYHKLKLKNQSIKGLEVKVTDENSGEFISGFGMGPFAKVHVNVPKNGILSVNNPTDSAAKISYQIKDQNASKTKKKSVVEETQPKFAKAKKYISFSLTNETAKSIPLQIPSVMNPNLSPFSRSGVDLKIGQKIFFKHKGRKHLLLQVSDEIKDGETVEVSSLIKKRKAELGL